MYKRKWVLIFIKRWHHSYSSISYPNTYSVSKSIVLMYELLFENSWTSYTYSKATYSVTEKMDRCNIKLLEMFPVEGNNTYSYKIKHGSHNVSFASSHALQHVSDKWVIVSWSDTGTEVWTFKHLLYFQTTNNLKIAWVECYISWNIRIKPFRLLTNSHLHCCKYWNIVVIIRSLNAVAWRIKINKMQMVNLQRGNCNVIKNELWKIKSAKPYLHWFIFIISTRLL